MIEYFTTTLEGVEQFRKTVQTGLGAVNVVKDLTAKLKKTDPVVSEIRNQLVDLTSVLVDAKLAHAEVEERIRTLQKEYEATQDKRQTLELYAFHETGSGATVLVLKDAANADKYPRFACPDCAADLKLIPLQPFGISESVKECSRCKQQYRFAEGPGSARYAGGFVV